MNLPTKSFGFEIDIQMVPMFHCCPWIGPSSGKLHQKLCLNVTLMVLSSGVRVGHGWATAQGAGYKGAPAPLSPLAH